MNSDGEDGTIRGTTVATEKLFEGKCKLEGGTRDDATNFARNSPERVIGWAEQRSDLGKKMMARRVPAK